MGKPISEPLQCVRSNLRVDVTWLAVMVVLSIERELELNEALPWRIVVHSELNNEENASLLGLNLSSGNMEARSTVVCVSWQNAEVLITRKGHPHFFEVPATVFVCRRGL